MTLAGRLVIGLLSGVALGSAFFGALWWTVHGLSELERPTRRVALSFLIRMGLLAVGLALVALLGALEIVSALAGILVARSLFVRSVEAGGWVSHGQRTPRGGTRCR